MPSVAVYTDGNGVFPELNPALGNKVHHIQAEANTVGIARLPNGTESGASSVGIRVKIGENEFVFVELTMELFLTTAKLFHSAENGEEPPENTPPNGALLN